MKSFKTAFKMMMALLVISWTGLAFAGSAPTKDASQSGQDFELDLNSGVAFGPGTGFGGGADGYFPVDKNLSLGGSAAFYTFSSGASETVQTSYITVTAGATSTSNVAELMFAGKYRFDGTNLKPYLLGGIGAAYVSGTANAGGTVNSGTGVVTQGENVTSSSVDPMLSVGAGVQVPLDKNLDFFAQTRLSLLISLGSSATVSGSTSATVSGTSGSTAAYLPIEAGLDFDL